MKRLSHMGGCALIVLALLGGVHDQVSAAEPAEIGALDGKTFVGEIGGQGKTRGDYDEFIFQDGTFRSTACDSYGFMEAAYTTTAEGDAIVFESQTTSPNEGTMVWKGTVRGNVIEGTTTWQKPSDGSAEEMWFTGELKS